MAPKTNVTDCPLPETKAAVPKERLENDEKLTWLAMLDECAIQGRLVGDIITGALQNHEEEKQNEAERCREREREEMERGPREREEREREREKNRQREEKAREERERRE